MREPQARQPLLFYDPAVGTSSRVTLVSSQLPDPYRVIEAQIFFPVGVEDQLRVSLFVSRDAQAPTALEPEGVRLFSPLGSASYLAGDAVLFTIPLDVPVRERETYLKVHARNMDASNTHPVNVILILAPFQGGAVQHG
jgi:hypothetical protein